MFLIIAFLGGMISLLSPCTLPVIPLLFAGFQRQRRHILALLAGMIVMFTLVAMVVTVASEWIAEATIVGRWIALIVLATAALALIFPAFAQRIAGPAVSAGNVLNTRSGQTRGMASAFLAGLAVGLLWSPCAGPILGAIFSINIAGHSAIATGALLAAYGSGCALMLGLLVFGGRTLMAPLRARSALMEKIRQGVGVVMLAAVVFNATGMTSALQGANGVANFINEFDTERLKRHEEEGFTFLIIADAEFYMIKHYGLLKSDGEMRSIEREWSPIRSRGCECDRYQYSLQSRPFTPYECPTQIIIEPVKKHRVWQEKQYKANLNKKCLRDRQIQHEHGHRD